jgi:hypothetical protein
MRKVNGHAVSPESTVPERPWGRPFPPGASGKPRGPDKRRPYRLTRNFSGTPARS